MELLDEVDLVAHKDWLVGMHVLNRCMGYDDGVFSMMGGGEDARSFSVGCVDSLTLVRPPTYYSCTCTYERTDGNEVSDWEISVATY